MSFQILTIRQSFLANFASRHFTTLLSDEIKDNKVERNDYWFFDLKCSHFFSHLVLCNFVYNFSQFTTFVCVFVFIDFTS